MDHLPVWEGRGAALGAELAEVGLHFLGHAAVLVPILVPAGPVVDGQPGIRRRQLRVLQSSGLQERIRTHGLPLAGIAGKAQTLSSTIALGCTSSKISTSRSST